MSIHIFTSNFDAESYLQAQLQQITPRDLSALKHKNIIVVPTKSLVRYFRNKCYLWGLSLGFQVLTIAEFAAWILQKHGIQPPKTSSLFSFLVREKALEGDKADFLDYVLELTENEEGADGLAGIEGTISELFKSGFDPEKIELYIQELDVEDVDMIKPILKLAARILAERDTLGALGKQEDLYWQAIDILREKGSPEALRYVFFYGLQDATAIISSFIEALHAQLGEEHCQLFLHKTRDPLFFAEKKLDSSNQIVDEFLSNRLCIQAEPIAHEGKEEGQPAFQYAKAVGRQAELRRAIQQVLQAVEGGLAWEDCAIVARDLTPYIPFIRSEVEKTGIPISLETPLYVSTPSSKRIQAFLKLLQLQSQCDVYCFLSLFHFQHATEECLYTTDDIQRYVREENCQTITDLLSVIKEDIEGLERSSQERGSRGEMSEREPRHYLRIVNRITEVGERKGQIVNLRKRRYLTLDVLKQLYTRLEAIQYRLFQLGRARNLEGQTQLAMQLLDELLQWRVLWDSERMIIYSALQRLQLQIPRQKMSWLDTRILLGRELHDAGKALVDQKGEGIRLFSATDAVGMTFSYLVLLGVNRDVFPQITKEDPILNRKISQQLRNQLPGFTLRERKYLVERHLLYWLICSAKQVLISWIVVDDKGNEMAEAPLIRRLISQEEQGDEIVLHVPSCFSASQDIDSSPIVEQVCLLGIRGDEGYLDRLPQVLHWAMQDFLWGEGLSGEQIAALREAVEKSLLLKNSEQPMLSVYDGMVGRSPNYPQLETELFVTRIEGVIQCPWQSFLVKVLGIPDRNQTNHYPTLQANDIGTIVHAVLEDMVNLQFTPEEIALVEVEKRLQQKIQTRTILWPSERELERMILARIDEQLDEVGIHFKGYREILLQQSKELLQTSFQQEFEQNQLVDCFGAEVEGRARFQVQHPFEKDSLMVSLAQDEPNTDINKLAAQQSGVVQCKFKADRIDLKCDDEGREYLYLVDYKTGRPIEKKPKKEANDKAMRTYLRKGQKLQIPIYTSCYQGLSEPHPTKGELLFLQQDLPQHFFGIDSQELEEKGVDQSSILEDTGKIVTTALAARTMGTFFPTIGGDGCKWCQLRETCRYRDDGFARKWERVQEKLSSTAETIEEKIVQSILDIRGEK